MGNAVEYTPPRGAFARAARNMGKARQEVERGYRAGKERFLVEVAKASFEIEKEAAEQRRQYREWLKKAKQLADDVNHMATQ